MRNESDRVAAIYEGKLAAKYDRTMSRFFDEKKREALSHTTISRGDRVLVMCCGTGRDFAPLLERIGTSGVIVAVDRSRAMLDHAKRRALDRGWFNIEFIEADARQRHSLGGPVDAAVCTLALSTIPESLSVYGRMVSAVRPGGYIVVGDMQLATGWRSISNLISVPLSRSFGGSWNGHRRSREISWRMLRELEGAKKKQFCFGAYFYSVGKKPEGS